MPTGAANGMGLAVLQSWVDHDVARWLVVLTAWGVLYPVLLWPGTPPALHPVVGAAFPYPIELRQIPIDRLFERAKEQTAERSRRLRALREEGHRQVAALDASLGDDESGGTAAAQIPAWIESVRAGLAEWISPSEAARAPAPRCATPSR